MPRPKNIRVVKKISKIVLGLEAEPHQGTTHYWGLPYQLVTPGAHSNKQTNKNVVEDVIDSNAIYDPSCENCIEVTSNLLTASYSQSPRSYLVLIHQVKIHPVNIEKHNCHNYHVVN